MSVAFDFATSPDVSYPIPHRVLAAVRPRPVAHSGPVASVSQLRPPCDAPPLHLTRRGVLVLTAAVVVIAGAVLAAAAWSAPHVATPAPLAPHGATVTVIQGDTLWGLAERLAPQRDPRAEVADLERVNHLPDETVRAGDVLRVP